MNSTNSSKRNVTFLKKMPTPSKKNVTPSKGKGKPSKKTISPLNKLGNKATVIECSSPIRSVGVTNCEKPRDYNCNDQFQCSETIPTTSETRQSHLEEPKKIINKLCTSLNKSNYFDEDDNLEDILEEDDEDNNHYFSKASLGSFMIFVSAPKKSVDLKPLDTCFYKPPFRVKEEEMKKAGFWKVVEAKFDRNIDFTAEDIEEDLIDKIESVIEHFKIFDSGAYDDAEGCSSDATQKINLHAPYLPMPCELTALQSMRIKEEFSPRVGNTIASTAFCSSGIKKKYGYFSRRESDRVRQNWENFKKAYRLYDLRPLLGYKTYLLEGNAERFTYSKVRYISSEQHYAFIKYLGQGLENRSLTQMYVHASCWLTEQVSTGSTANKPASSWDLHLIDLFLKKYGVSMKLMEFLLHSKSSTQLGKIFERFYLYRRCPINFGSWSSAEVLRLVDAIAHYSQQPAALQRSALPGAYKCPISWGKVFERVQTRTPVDCGAMFHNVLKQALKSRYYSNKKQDEGLQWTAKHELLLIEELCKTPEDSLARVDFYRLSQREDFAAFCDDFLRRVANDVIRSKVPVNKRRYFDDCLDYLAKEVLPVLSKKIEEHEEVFNKHYLSKSNDMMQVFPDYLNKYVIKMFSSLPLQESTDLLEALQDFGEDENEPTDSVPTIASPTNNSDETRETLPSSYTDSRPSQQRDIIVEAAPKRSRQRQLNLSRSDRSQEKNRKKQRLTYDDLVPFSSQSVPTSIPLDVITID